MSPLMERLGVKYPLFQGGMAWVADGKLAASVSEAGGLGIIGSGHAPASWVKEQIEVAKSMTDKAFGVNVMLLSPFVEQVIDVIVDAKVALVTTGSYPLSGTAPAKRHCGHAGCAVGCDG